MPSHYGILGLVPLTSSLPRDALTLFELRIKDVLFNVLDAGTDATVKGSMYTRRKEEFR